MNVIYWCTVWLIVGYLKEVKTDVCHYVSEVGDMYCKDVNIGVLRSGYYPINGTKIDKLRRLNVVSAKLTSVDSNAFQNLTSLVYLEMNDNEIQELDNSLFKNTPGLRQLFVARNKIKSLDKMLFNTLPMLTHLDISGNPLSSLTDSEIFMSLNNLLYLIADNVKLNRIPTDLLEPLKSLREVRISDNDIKCHCYLRNITTWVKEKCFSMKVSCKGKLGTTHSSLQSYFDNRCGPNGRIKLRRTYKFDPSYRFNRGYPSYHSRSRPWDYPSFDYDRYNFERPRYPHIYESPEDKDYIYDDTDVTETPESNITVVCPNKQCRFSSQLDRMDCEANDLTNFRSDNYPFTERGFSELILDNNKLVNLEANAFNTLPELIYLSLRKNGLKTLNSNVFKELKNLRYLDLSDNVLGNALMDSTIFSSQKRLRILHVNNNGMLSLHPELFKPITSLKRLFMSDNPFDCNCDLKPSLTIIKKRKVFHRATCRYPVLYNDKSWDVLEEATYCRLSFNHISTPTETDSTTLTILFFGIILLIVGTVQLIHYLVNKFHKPKEGDDYYIPEDFDDLF